MDETNRNIRTLIVSFAVAIFTLIPLRFIEAGQEFQSQPQVLGVEVSPPKEESKDLPILEEPYNQIENAEITSSCIDSELSNGLLSDHEKVLSQSGLDGETVNQLVNEMKVIEDQTCK